MWEPISGGVSTRARVAGAALIAALLLLILSSVVHLDWVPWPVRLALIALAALSAWRPEYGLLIVAGLTPLAWSLGRRWNAGVAWPETLVIAFAAGWSVRGISRPSGAPALPAAVRAPTVLFALVLAGSVLIDLSVRQVRLGSGGVMRLLWDYFSRDYFANGPRLASVHAGALLLEGLILFSASARLGAANRTFPTRVVRALCASAAAAAGITLQQLIGSALRVQPFWGTLAERLATARVNAAYPDANAAGSHFVMLLFVAVGLTLGMRRSDRAWALAAVAMLFGLWMSGSRAAMVAGLMTLAMILLPGVRAGSPRRRLGFWAAGLALGLGALLVLQLARPRQAEPSAAAVIRVELMRTALRMVAEDPFFGVGLGEFYQRSGEFSSAELFRRFPVAIHENAHNNFLQVLAETGLVGFAVFVWLLGAALSIGWRARRSGQSSVSGWSCLAGIVAFLLTCVGGHPLLTREPAYAFWLLLGTMVGAVVPVATAETVAPSGGRRASQLLVLAAAMVLATIPARAAVSRAQANLEHLGIGLSVWQTAGDGTRYRSAVDGATLFVPAETGFHFRIRTLERTPQRVELRLAGRLADVVVLAPNVWNEIAMPPRRDRAESRYTSLDLRVLREKAGPVEIWITKVEQVGQ